MANLVQLNATDSNQVGSAGKVSILTAEANTWLFIFTGIAKQEQFSEDHGFLNGISGETDARVEVYLTNISGVLLESATVTGLNDIYTDDDLSDWSILNSWLEHRDNGDLVLIVNTIVVGDSGFSAFSYQVNAKIVIDEATISGTVRCQKSIATPLSPPYFAITANSQKVVGGLMGIQYIVEATGVEDVLNSTDKEYYYIPYVIKGALLGKSLTVLITIDSNSFTIKIVGNYFLGIEQINGPNVISLTSFNRHQTNVDFEIQLRDGLR
jgi:hypothetical protein